MNKSKNIEVIEIIVPNIINGLDFSSMLAFGFFVVVDEIAPLLLLTRFLKGLITIDLNIKFINLNSRINFYDSQLCFDNLLQE